MYNTEILIYANTNTAVTTARKFGINITITDDAEVVLKMLVHRHFDILINDRAGDLHDRVRLSLLAPKLNPDLISMVSDANDSNLSKAIAQTIRTKTLNTFGHFELHEMN